VECDKKIKALLYEVSLYLAENKHDYEARELHEKVSRAMDNADFEEGRVAAAAAHEKEALAKVSNFK
jgi:hypothetical protein